MMKVHPMTKTLMSSVLITTLTLGGFSGSAQQALDALRRSEQILTKAATEAFTNGIVPGADEATQARVSEAYAKLPLSFEANHGQTDSQVKFLARGSGYTLFLTPSEAVLTLRKGESAKPKDNVKSKADSSFSAQPSSSSTLRMQLVGANPQPQVMGVEKLPGKVNYFIGNDPKQWHSGVPTYSRVEYQEVYPGVDLVYYGNQHQLEYDFVVAPGAKPNEIELAFEGADKLEIDAEGNLVVGIEGVEVIQRAPVSYQEIDGVRNTISSRYELRDERRVGFEVDRYDTSRTLVIDPVLLYSTYLGGSGWDFALDITVASPGLAFVTGSAQMGFPTPSGAYDGSFSGMSYNNDVFVTMLDFQGSSLVYSTFLGGSSNECGFGITLDGAGLPWVTGWTLSTDFPTTMGAYDRSHNGPVNGSDVFVAKLNNGGSALAFSTFLGGSSHEEGHSIAVDGVGIVYVAGFTNSFDFPTTQGAWDRILNDNNNNGRSDGFVTKLNSAGSNLAYSTFVGGQGNDYIRDISIDGQGPDLNTSDGLDVYVTGSTTSMDFPTTQGAFDESHNGPIPNVFSGRAGKDAFVTVLNPQLDQIIASTFIGGKEDEESNAIAFSGGIVAITGWTRSPDFPTTQGAYDRSINGPQGAVNPENAFVAVLALDRLIWSTFLGGSCGFNSGNDIALDGTGFVYVTGETLCKDFPLVNPIQNGNAGGQDIFVAKLNGKGNTLLFSTYLGGSWNDSGWGISVVNVNGVPITFVAGWSESNDFPTASKQSYDRTFNGGYDAVVISLSAQ